MNYYEQLQQGHYGSMELKNHQSHYLLTGLLISFLLHSTLIGIPYMLGLLTNQGVKQIPLVLKPIFPPSRPAPDVPAVFRVPPPSITATVDKHAKPIAVEKEPIETPFVDPSQTLPGVPKDFEGAIPGNVENPPFAGNLTIDDPIPDRGVFIPREVDPIALETNPQPQYPDIARISSVSGKVRVQVFVDKKGDVKQYFILSTNPPNLGFEEAVEKVITKWKFTPAIQQGNPVGVWISIPFNFTIKK